jgi:hypothetical protein
VVGSLVVRPRLGGRAGHELVDADGRVLVGLDVAPDRNGGAIVVEDRRWSVQRPPSSRRWTVTSASGPALATITKPSAIRERFELVVADEPVTIEPRGPIGRRRWSVARRGEPTIEVVQGVVRRRWHDLHAVGTASMLRGGVVEPLTCVVAFVVALVDTTPPSGLRGLPRATR